MKKFIGFSCTHFPLQDDKAINWLGENIEMEKPDVIVHLGDGHEADAPSRWPSEYLHTLLDEFRQHNKFLKYLRQIAPNARKVFLPGNHEENITGANRIAPKLRGLCDYRELEPELEHWEQPAEYVYDRNRGVFRLGQVTFAHGFEANASSDELQSITLGLPYGLTVLGHTHRPVAVTQAKRTAVVPLPYWFANSGCLLNMNIEYMRRKRSHLWGQGLVVGTYNDWRYSQSMMPQQPEWDAETRVYRMFNDV